MGKQMKVICLEESGGDPVSDIKIEKTINDMLGQGWSFSQLTTGGVAYCMRDDGSSSCVNIWVYILFEKQ